MIEEQVCKHDADCGCLKELAERRLDDIKEMQKELDILTAALEQISEMKDQTLLGCQHDEFHMECEGRLAHEIGANKAFNQAAGIAIRALAALTESNLKEKK